LRLRRQYGITAAQYEEILAYQGGVCATCGKPPKEGKNLNVDHDHKTGLVRGLLCWSCNRRLIADHRDSNLLRRGADYLDVPPAVGAIGPVFGRTGRVTKKRRKTTKRRRTSSV
jgi:hypothetical protein